MKDKRLLSQFQENYLFHFYQTPNNIKTNIQKKSSSNAHIHHFNHVQIGEYQLVYQFEQFFVQH